VFDARDCKKSNIFLKIVFLSIIYNALSLKIISDNASPSLIVKGSINLFIAIRKKRIKTAAKKK
jgi:hypothetical protein